jgi:hypothetical protein
MPTPTYTAIAKSVLTGTQGSIVFSDIPNTYKDLLIKISARTDNTGTFYNYLRFNGDTGSNYQWRIIYGYNSGTYSDPSGGYVTFGWGGYTNNSSLTASTFGNSEVYIGNYAGSNQKGIFADAVMETNAVNGVSLGLGASFWNSTSAITSITLLPSVGSYVSGSRFDLYGIKNS